MILMIAPAPDMVFGAMPSGAVYVSNPYGLVFVANDSTADQAALQSAGCFTLTPFGGWGNFGFQTQADLFAADTGSILPGVTGYPPFTVATVFNDPSSGNDGTWYKTGTGNGAGAWTQLSTQTLASLSALIPDAVPWAGTTFAQVSQLKAALVADGTFAALEAAILADPTNAASQQWTGGGVATVGGPLAAAIKTALGASTAQMNDLWAAAAAEPF
jgi:hypothetical protein